VLSTDAFYEINGDNSPPIAPPLIRADGISKAGTELTLIPMPLPLSSMAGTEPASRAAPVSVSLPSLRIELRTMREAAHTSPKRALRTLLRFEEGLIKDPEHESSSVLAHSVMIIIKMTLGISM
jgi:hypothetical protein